ncbi:MAG: zf-HC2 domain-containing protein [Planctomycetes bacterium]|nr:zf-HC2 domain-containing protein [Planctomycetota bacterium]
MSCEVSSGERSAFLDGELGSPRAREVGAHLGTCPGCRAEIERLRGVDAAIRLAEAPEVPPTLRARILEAARPPASTRRRRWVVRAAAAALLLGAGALLLLRSDDARSPQRQVARQAALLDSIELDAAALRLLLAAEEGSADVDPNLAARIEAVLGKVRELRREGLPAERQGG